jgi:hypothetical protein
MQYSSDHSSMSSGYLCVNKDELSSIYDRSLQRWVDQSCGYHFRKDSLDDQSCGYSLRHDFLPPTHLHEFHFMIDYIFIYSHDHYMLDLSLLFYIINHMGRYSDKMINWLHWLYDFT